MYCGRCHSDLFRQGVERPRPYSTRCPARRASRDDARGINEGGTSMTQATSAKADLILHNGRIATLDARNPVAEVAALLDGKFVAVGPGNEVLKLRGDRTQI